MRKMLRPSRLEAMPVLVVVVMLLLNHHNVVAEGGGGAVEMEYLSVPNSVFIETLKTTIDVVVEVTSMVGKFSGVFGDTSRVSHAINDCLDLMDLSSDDLSKTLFAYQHGGKTNGTGDLGADLKTWLSATLGNQATCLDGFEGTGSMVKTLIAGGINQASSLVQQILHMVHQTPQSSRSNSATPNGTRSRGHRRLLTKIDTDEFPLWINSKDRKLLQIESLTPDIVVAQDGSGNFTKIIDAINAAPNHSTDRFVIYLKKGVYDEIVEIKRKKSYIMMYGDGMDVTIITGNQNYVDGWTTYRSATLGVSGAGFIARDLTIQNTAGPSKHQAVAFRSDSDLSVLYRCAFRGYQDTLYAHSNRQFYRECLITGTVDFIFGDAIAVIQTSQIQSRLGLPNQKNTITAQGRKDPGENTGFSIQFCNITAEKTAFPQNSTATYLGRPWKQFSRTVIMESYIGENVKPQGWLEWNGDLYLDTLYYGEYMNYGPSANIGSRVNWTGFHIFNTSAQALGFTVAQFLNGDMWLPSTGVKYVSGLSTL